MSEIEERLSQALRGLPDAPPQARDRAVRRAIESASPRRSVRGRPLALAAAAAVAVIGAGAALAGTGTLRVSVGTDTQAARVQTSTTRGLSLPPGAHGIAVLAGGRVHLRTRGDVGIDGLRATAVALSPNALYLALGQRRSLTVLSPSGRQAWTQPAKGPVVAASWAPYPIWIAYVVTLPGGRNQLRLIEGDGDHDHLVANGVALTRPYWSQDSTRLHYVKNGGWMIYTPSTGRTALGQTERDGPTCGDSCPIAEPAPVRQRRRDGAAQVGFSTTPVGATWALRAKDTLEVWWAARGARTGQARLVMRTNDVTGPVQVSLR